MNSNAILLVDDNSSDIELTKLALIREHITNKVIVAEDGQQALDYMFGSGLYKGERTFRKCLHLFCSTSTFQL